MTSHNLHILLGDSAEQNICRIKEYVIKYGFEYADSAGVKAPEYLQLMLYSDDCRFYVAKQRTAADEEFVSGIEDSYSVELEAVTDSMAGENSEAKLQNFFRQRFKSTVNLNRPGDRSLHVCIHLPLYNANAWAQAESLMAAITATDANFTIDLMMLGVDLAHLTISDNDFIINNAEALRVTAKQVLMAAVEAKTSGRYPRLNSLVLVENENESGLALNLVTESYANLMGEYVLATTTAYNEIYTLNFLQDAAVGRPILGLGLSMLNFDRYYFVQYMLRKAYIHILDREGIMQESVDVNKASNIVQGVLAKNIKIFSNIYESEVKPKLDDGKLSHMDILADIKPVMDAEIERVERELLEFIDSDSLTLPEKRATLAQLLGEDDVLLQGAMFNTAQFILDDCRNDVLEIFVKANNELATVAEDALDSHAEPLRNSAILSDIPGVPITSAETRMSRIKGLKAEIKTSTDYIRRQEIILRELEANVQQESDSQKCLTEDGFHFGGQTYRLLPKNIERPLEEDYVPMVGKLPTEADLRQYFTRVKDQGELGSCTAFATVSVYEYLLKRNKGTDVDLSELYAYQNARKRSENTDGEGTSIYNMIKGIGEDGLCIENLHPYTTENMPEPSEEAVADAQTRKINKALNVKCSLQDIKSAVAQGYPVIIALQLFEGFSSSTGFVPHPTEDDRKNRKDSSHAMVVCGYSDAEKVFIVRNSWGVRFGDAGYCYIPYSYVTDPDLMYQACIITEISEAEIKAAPNPEKITVSFNKQDAKVQAAILRTLVEEERENVNYLSEQLAELRHDYYEFISKLGKHNLRQTLCKATCDRLTWEIGRLEERKLSLNRERLEKLDAVDSSNRHLWIISGIAIVAMLVIYGVVAYFSPYVNFILDIIYPMVGLGFLSVGYSTYIYRETEKLVPAKYAAEHTSKVNNMWIFWAISLLLAVVSFVILAWLLDIFLLNHGVGWLILGLLSYVPFLYAFYARRNIRKQIDEDYMSQIILVANNIDLRAKLRHEMPVKVDIAGSILDSLTMLISRLRKKCYSLRSYVDNLRMWRQENAKAVDMQPVNRQPFMSLIKNECLDAYFDKEKENITEDISLHQLFRDKYDVDEKQVTAFKKELKLRLGKTLWNKVSDFSIYDHVTGARDYAYVDKEVVDMGRLINTMDGNSEIFVNTTMRMHDATADAVCCKMMFRSAPGNDGSRGWDESVQSYFMMKPQMHDLSSDYKVFIIRLEGLSPSEIDLLR